MSHPVTRAALTVCLFAPFVLCPVFAVGLAGLALALLPLTLTVCLLFLLCLCCALLLLLSHCHSRQWRVDAQSRWAVRGLAGVVLLFECLAVWACDVGATYQSWAAFFLTANCLPLLVLVYRGGGCLSQSASLSLYLSSALVLAVWAAVMAQQSFGYVACASSLALLLLDGVCLLLHRAGEEGGYRPHPLRAALFLVACRVGVAGGGVDRFLLGHSLLFAVLFLSLWPTFLDCAAPQRRLRLERPFAPLQEEGEEGDAAVKVAEEAASVAGGGARVASPPSAPVPWPFLPPLSASFAQAPLVCLSLLLLCLLFAADVAVTVFLVLRAQLPLDGAQWPADEAATVASLLSAFPSLVAAAVAAVVSLHGALLSLAARLYCNAHYRLTCGAVAAAAVACAALQAVAALLAWADGGVGGGRQWTLPVLVLLFGPVAALVAAHCLAQWAVRDFRLTAAAEFSRTVRDSRTKDGEDKRRRLRAVRWWDLSMLLSLALLAALALSFAASAWLLCTPSTLGPLSALVALVAVFTALPLCRWLHVYRWNRTMTGQLAVAQVGVAGLSVYVWLAVRGGAMDVVAFALLCLPFVHGSGAALLLALSKWRDDGWAMTGPTVALLLAALYALTLLCFLTALLFSPFYIGAAALLLTVAALAAALTLGPVLSAGGRKGGGRLCSPSTWRLLTAASVLAACAVPIAVGVWSSDAWLTFTSLTALLAVACLLSALRFASLFFHAALPLPWLSASELSALCRPPSSYLAGSGEDWLGLVVLPVASAGHESEVRPPLSLRPALLSLHLLALLAFVWGHLAFFFPFSQESGQGDVSLVAVAAAVLLSSLTACQTRWTADSTRRAFDRLLRGAALEGETAGAVEDGGPTVEEAADEGSGAAEAVEELSSAALLRKARARAKRSVHVAVPFSSAAAASAAATASSASAKLFARRPPHSSSSSSPSSPSSIQRLSEDERLSFVQSVQALIGRSSVCGSRGELDAAVALLASHGRWEAASRLFPLALHVHLHHLLLVQRHSQLQSHAQLIALWERERGERRQEGGGGGRLCCPEPCGPPPSGAMTLSYLALLSLHHSLRPSAAFSALQAPLPAWLLHRRHVLRLVRSRAAERDAARLQRAQAAELRGRLAHQQRREALQQRRTERLKALRSSRETAEEEKRRRREVVEETLQRLKDSHRTQMREWRRRVKREEEAEEGRGEEEKEAVDSASPSDVAVIAASSAVSEAARVERLEAKRRQQREWRLKQRLVQTFTGGSTSAAPLPSYQQLSEQVGRGSAAPPTSSSSHRPHCSPSPHGEASREAEVSGHRRCLRPSTRRLTAAARRLLLSHLPSRPLLCCVVCQAVASRTAEKVRTAD